METKGLRVGRLLTPPDDQLARLLREMGFSYRRIATLMRTTDKTAKEAVLRSKAGTSAFLAKQETKAKALLGLQQWLQVGADHGYLKALAAYLE